jgi:hypothetical protein
MTYLILTPRILMKHVNQIAASWPGWIVEETSGVEEWN